MPVALHVIPRLTNKINITSIPHITMLCQPYRPNQEAVSRHSWGLKGRCKLSSGVQAENKEIYRNFWFMGAAQCLWSCSNTRVRPKFGFGYGAETDLTYGFGLVSATDKVQWHKFGFGRNITPQRRNRRNWKIGANCNIVAVWQFRVHSAWG